MKHVGAPPTRRTLLAPSAKRRVGRVARRLTCILPRTDCDADVLAYRKDDSIERYDSFLVWPLPDTVDREGGCPVAVRSGERGRWSNEDRNSLRPAWTKWLKVYRIYTPTLYNPKINHYGKIFLSSQNWVFRPNIRVLLGGKAENTDRLLEMLPAVFCELSGTMSRFSTVLVSFLEQPISFLWRVRKKAVGQN